MAERTLWRKIEERLHLLADEFPAVIGLAFRDLATGREILINPDEVFPAASVIKVGVLIELIRAAGEGRCRLDERIVVTAADRVAGSGVLTHLDEPVSLTLKDLANLMIVASDNVAANICIERVGMNRVNALFRELGLEHTNLARRMMDDAAVRAGEENVATPRELIKLFATLYEGEHQAGRPVSSEVAGEVLRILRKPKDEPIRRPLPPDLPVAGKPGKVDGAAADAAIVYLQDRPYVLAVMTKYLLGTDGEEVIAGLSKVIHEYMGVLSDSTPMGRRLPPDRGKDGPAAARQVTLP